MTRFYVVMVLYPLLQCAAFAAACFSGSWLIAIPLVLVAVACMNFSLHITAHFHVHFKTRQAVLDRLLDFFFTLSLGLPFHYYQLNHWNHHRFNNMPGDYTSTYRQTEKGLVPRNPFFYSFFWFINSQGMGSQVKTEKANGFFSNRDHRKLRVEGVLLLLFHALLIWLSWEWWVLYLGMIYLGWSIIALYNYGQHLPDMLDVKGKTFDNKLYNVITANNGLHEEHHNRPQLKYWEQSTAHSKESRTRRPFFLNFFSYLFRTSQW